MPDVMGNVGDGMPPARAGVFSSLGNWWREVL